MIGAGFPGVPATADPVVSLAVAALQLQDESLRAAADRLTACRRSVPGSADGTWRGPAHTAYETGLEHLRHLLLASGAAVDEAIAETRRAVATMEQER